MKEEANAFELLRQTNRIADQDVPGSDTPEAQQLLARILATPRDQQTPVGADRRRLRVVLAVAAISLVTIAATWILIRSISIPNAIICHQAVDLDSDSAAAPAGDTATAEACIPVWENETLANPDITPPGFVPPLTACIAENGALVVLPTEDTSVCSRLGLARPDPATQESADNIRTLENQLIEYFQTAECIPIAEATERVSDMAERHGLGSWVIEAQDETPERPCASFSIDPESETIFIIPIPQP